MARNIFRKAGILFLNVLKGLLQAILFIFKLVLNLLKAILLLFAYILRIFLSFFGVSIRD